MKKYIIATIILTVIPLLNMVAQVGISTNNPNKDAVLDLNTTSGSATKGLLMPKVALTSTDSPAPLSTHVAGMHVYNTATTGIDNTQVLPGEYFNNGTSWIRIQSTGWGLQGNSTNTTSNFLGTTDAIDLPIRTNNIEKMRISAAGQLLTGTTTTPTGGTTAKVILNNNTVGALQLKDGTEGANYILTSDAKGVATWQQQTIEAYYLQNFGSGVSIPSSPLNTWYNSNTSITLPPGKWLVSTSIILNNGNWTGTNESWWLLSSFSESNAVLNITPDIIGGATMSGLLPPKCQYYLLSGSVVINNTSGADKVYYYIGRVAAVASSSGRSLVAFGGSKWGENSISWQQIQ